EEKPSPYNSSTIDNNSAFTQSQGRDAIQPIQKDTPNNIGVSENDDDSGCIRVQEWEEAFLKGLMMIEDLLKKLQTDLVTQDFVKN
ncbi:MAG: hypothetical protein WBL88_15445, partial [Nitrososphaeraceae archaeon]